MSQYHWNGNDKRFYTTKPSPDRKNETEVIQTSSGSGRWNTDAIAVASSLDPKVAERIAELLGTHGISKMQLPQPNTTQPQSLSVREYNIRMNIRNAFLVATKDELDKEIKLRIERNDLISVKFLEELKAELDQ